MGIITAVGAKDPSDPTWETDAEIKAYRDFIKEYLRGGDPTNALPALDMRPESCLPKRFAAAVTISPASTSSMW
jgi:hypothetical protein